MSLRSSQRINWKQREKLASTQLSTYSSPSGRDRPPVAQALVDRNHVVVAEMLDHHEQHCCRPWPLQPRVDAACAQTFSGGGCPSTSGRLGSKHAQSGADLVQMVAVGAARLGSSSEPARTKIRVRPLFRLAEHIRPAPGAETPVHGRAAVGFADVIGQRTGNGDVLCAEKGADRPGSRAKILADAAPAIARAERRVGLDLVAHRPAKTPARNRQGQPPHQPAHMNHMRNCDAPASEWGDRAPARQG